MSKPSVFARETALFWHGNQDHGCLKIGEHLADVAKNTAKHFNKSWRCDEGSSRFKDEVVAAAWLHDVIEDTKMTQARLLVDLEANCEHGDYITQLVGLLTDKKGKSRKERHLKTYYAIRPSAHATLIKLCDRRHNQARSIKHGEIYASMYEREYDYFKFALWQPNEYVELWEELDGQYQEMRRILGI